MRIDAAVHDAIARLAAAELRSVNAQIEIMLREELRRRGALPVDAGELPRRGRPPKPKPAPELDTEPEPIPTLKHDVD